MKTPDQRQRGIMLTKKGKEVSVIDASYNEANRNWVKQIEKDLNRQRGSRYMPGAAFSKYHVKRS